jgi:hypothetical protein
MLLWRVFARVQWKTKVMEHCVGYLILVLYFVCYMYIFCYLLFLDNSVVGWCYLVQKFLSDRCFPYLLVRFTSVLLIFIFL